jgi:F-type H+-transporting ATPase subunit b
MGETFSQLGHLFLQTIPTVIFVFLLYFILDRIFFRPVTAVLKKREEATVGALARSRELGATAEGKARGYEEAFQAAREEVYRQREAARRASQGERDAVLRQARSRSDDMIQDAQAALAAEVTRVKGELEIACQSLAEEISQTLVGPGTPSGGGGL